MNTTVLLGSTKKNTSAIRVSPQVTSVNVSNSITIGATRTGYNARGSTVQDSISYNPRSTEKEFDIKKCIQHCKKLNPNSLNNESLEFSIHPFKQPKLVSLALGDTHPGAVITHKTGIDGSRFGEKNYNSLSKNILWPWPNEEIILTDICSKTINKKGICKSSHKINKVFNYILDTLKTSKLY